MDPYELLRKDAAHKMDLAIKAARDEYRQTVDKINVLRAELGHTKPLGLRTKKTISEIIPEHIPQDRPFTILELIDNCQAAYPTHRFKRASVNTIMHRRQEQGLERRVGKDVEGFTLWAVADLDIETMPYANMPISSVIKDILGDSGSMRAAELVIAMQELGYRSDIAPDKLLRAVRKSLQNNPRKFSSDGNGGWRVS